MRTVSGKSRDMQINTYVPVDVFEKFKIAAAIDGVAYSYKAFLVIQQYVEDHAQEIEEYAAFMDKFHKKNAATNTTRQSIKVN